MAGCFFSCLSVLADWPRLYRYRCNFLGVWTFPSKESKIGWYFFVQRPIWAWPPQFKPTTLKLPCIHGNLCSISEWLLKLLDNVMEAVFIVDVVSISSFVATWSMGLAWKELPCSVNGNTFVFFYLYTTLLTIAIYLLSVNPWLGFLLSILSAQKWH